MKRISLAVVLALGALALAQQAHAAACVNGVYRAGCVGPNVAAVVHKPYRPMLSPASTGSTEPDASDPMELRSSASDIDPAFLFAATVELLSASSKLPPNPLAARQP